MLGSENEQTRPVSAGRNSLVSATLDVRGFPGLLTRPLRQAREQDRELGLTTRIRLGQDCFETLPDGFDAESLIIGNFVKIAPAGKADCDSCLRWRETESLPQNFFSRFALFVRIYQHNYALGLMLEIGGCSPATPIAVGCLLGISPTFP